MHRFFLCLLAACSLSASVLADENIRAVQTKLKEQGFYFGQVSGDKSAELSAAVTRFQIRQGLQINGQLDDATSRALGVKAEAINSGTASETWRRLRKSDAEFSNNPKTEIAAAPTKRATAALTRAKYENGPAFVLSKERFRDYIGAFVLAGIDPQTGAELEFFGPRVCYYNDGMVDRARIRRDLQRYAARWPERRFWLAGDVKADVQPDSKLRVTFPLRYELRNGKKSASGKIEKTLLLEVIGEDMQIIAVNEHKA